MKLLYWNLNKNPKIGQYIIDCIKENDVDVFICSEFENIDFDYIVKNLAGYVIAEGFGGCEKVKIIFKNTHSIKIKREQHRYLLTELDSRYLIVGVHLDSNYPNDGTMNRIFTIQNILADIRNYENENFIDNKYRTIVIGDMNASPFDKEMISKTCFNSVLYKDLIKHRKYNIYNGHKCYRFYNPIINYIDEKQKNYGSFYYSSKVDSLFWYAYDQILLRAELADSITDYKYLKKIKGINLIKSIGPDNKISDHLPLFVELNLKEK